jgi:hypothetical protein
MTSSPRSLGSLNHFLDRSSTFGLTIPSSLSCPAGEVNERRPVLGRGSEAPPVVVGTVAPSPASTAFARPQVHPSQAPMLSMSQSLSSRVLQVIRALQYDRYAKVEMQATTVPGG